jgi:hypothetical protein
MERITYLLGAGFSAPLGLPVMSNFIEKSKDLYFDNTEKYQHFEKVLDTIRDLSHIKNYCNVDLTNIEEILSILEMHNYVANISSQNKEKQTAQEDFKKYLIDVINGFTNIGNYQTQYVNENMIDSLFGTTREHVLYAAFISQLFNFKYTKIGDDEKKYGLSRIPSDIKYSIITLNYDLVLETILERLGKCFVCPKEFIFEKYEYNSTWENPHLIKLHGCAGSGNIIPPTWAKGTNNNREIRKVWNNGYQVLRDSTQIRIIGYSLPISDAYIKYLLKAALMENKRLKKIDVILLDPTGLAQKRYDNFIDFHKYEFKDRNLLEYFDKIRHVYDRTKFGANEVSMNVLEYVHEDFTRTY